MVAHESHPGAMASRHTGRTATEPVPPYTGVVLIHGIGDIERDEMLQQVVDALSYWLNHESGFALRPEGPGRLWLTTALTEDEDPDAPASRATIELVAQELPAGTPGAEDALRLDIREVWWAESAGQPSVATTIRWARVQWREQWTHLLIPVGRRFGPAHIAARTPARETPQALTYRPADGGPHPLPSLPADSASPLAAGEGPGVRSPEPLDARLERVALRSALALFETFQYAWKVLQWLLLTPAIALLLLAMRAVQLLALVPFLEPAVLAGLGAITDRIMLHWVAEMQVYLLDYTRSSAIRRRFEREVDAFLRDPACDRVVAIAYSMGTAIAYEGLTTTLAQPDLPDAEKPVTFVTLGAALRRAWLMAEADPHRLHGVLPERVRWVNFWARYDPVAAGPLSPRALPPLDDWDDPARPNPHAAICASLGRCENVDVANTDSTLFDHLTYFANLEQVIGPLARELVAGHPTLERAVGAHLAGADDVLRRRGRVAWRATVSVLGGLAAGAAFLTWDFSNRQPTTRLPFGFGHGLLQYGPGIVGTAIGNIGPVGALLGLFGGWWAGSPLALGLQGVAGPRGAVPQPVMDGAASVVAALAVAGLGVLAIGRLVAPSSPLDLTGAPRDAGTPRTIPILAAISLVLLTQVIAPVNGSANPSGLGPGIVFAAVQALLGHPLPETVVVATFYLATLLGTVAVFLGLADAAQHRRWGWFLILLLVTLAFAAPIAFYAGARPILGPVVGESSPTLGPTAQDFVFNVAYCSYVIGLIGVGAGVIEAVRLRRWSWLAGPALALLVGGIFGVNALAMSDQQFFSLFGSGLLAYFAAFIPPLLYGLADDVAGRAPRARADVLPSRGLLRHGSVTLVMVFTFGSFIPTPQAVWVILDIVEVLIAATGAFLALHALGRARRWWWVATFLIIPPAMLLASYNNDPSFLTGHPLDALWQMFAPFLSVALLSVGLWAAPSPVVRVTPPRPPLSASPRPPRWARGRG